MVKHVVKADPVEGKWAGVATTAQPVENGRPLECWLMCAYYIWIVCGGKKQPWCALVSIYGQPKLYTRQAAEGKIT